ncbi:MULTISPECIES: IS5 family transposase [Methylobacterium]|uniref:IS5 family transposase n=1 Tax=Methylobacterium TaxID=407 RepID=UPI00272E394D|nr:IS5 family transposase [Methylobacterium sp.]
MAPFMPTNQPPARRKDDRTILSGILHVIKSDCRWKDCPSEYDPHTTVYNRFNRWARRRFWTGMLEALAKAGWSGEAAALDSTYVKAQRADHGGKGGPTTKIHVLTDVIGRPGVIHLTPGNASDVKTAPAVLDKAPYPVRRLIADKGYDADWLRQDLREQGISVVIPGTRARKRKIRLDKRRYRDRWRVEALVCRLKDFRSIATRYDKLARNFASALALALATVIAFWC